MKRTVWLLIVLLMIPTLAQAWWNNDWGYRKKITLDQQKLQQAAVKISGETLALVRLHTGNFSFFPDLGENGKALRFVSLDDKTPLKFYIEKIDFANEMAFIWVRLPKDTATAADPSFWMYYSNEKAAPESGSAGIYDENQVLAYHFDTAEVNDATSNNNKPTVATNTVLIGGAIGDAGAFDGSQQLRISGAPSLQMSMTPGWTFSAWVKIDQPQNEGVVFTRDKLSLLIRGQQPILKIGTRELPSPSSLNLSLWQHLAVVANSGGLTLYVDGKPMGALQAPEIVALEGDVSIGADVSSGAVSQGFSGGIDEVSVIKAPLDQNAVQLMQLMQVGNSDLLAYGEDAGPDSEEGPSYFMATLDNVTIDGWVVIGILMVMFLISWIVMIGKGIVLARIERENRKFEKAFAKLSLAEITNLDHEDEEGSEDYDESPLLLSLTGNHAEFAGSSIYRIYHIGVQEISKRIVKPAGSDVLYEPTLSGPALNAIRSSMDGTMVRELQKLNSQMVLLTIAIAGGPFLGLLGTVVGVMITFAAIAVSGEINVNSIAPGIAAALTATVAGLGVAIPALFGYNYLGSKIKVITADMHVFVDEFITKIAEQYSV